MVQSYFSAALCRAMPPDFTERNNFAGGLNRRKYFTVWVERCSHCLQWVQWSDPVPTGKLLAGRGQQPGPHLLALSLASWMFKQIIDFSAPESPPLLMFININNMMWDQEALLCIDLLCSMGIIGHLTSLSSLASHSHSPHDGWLTQVTPFRFFSLLAFKLVGVCSHLCSLTFLFQISSLWPRAFTCMLPGSSGV